MVRINLIKPRYLTDQHLIAEYNEMLMLLGYVKKYPSLEDIPEKFSLNKGHIKFFKNKLSYVKKRHELIKKEMKKRGFETNKTISLSNFKTSMKKDWKPSKADKNIIKKRLIEKINLKPKFYRYYGEHKPKKFFINLIKTSA